jgi:hypothetical protein
VGSPHATCDVAGGWNLFTVWLLRHSQRKRGAMDRPDLRNPAPVLDAPRRISFRHAVSRVVRPCTTNVIYRTTSTDPSLA